MKRIPKISLPVRKKGKYKPLVGAYSYDLGKLVFDKSVKIKGKDEK